MDQIEKKFLNWLYGEDTLNWSKSETKLAVLAVILQKSRKRNQTIAATSIRQIKNWLKKYYNKDLTERQILNVIRSLERIVVKEKDPRNHRRTLYRINQAQLKKLPLHLSTSTTRKHIKITTSKSYSAPPSYQQKRKNS